MQSKRLAWVTSGYLGAINSGETTCGLLIGSSVAIGLKVGFAKEQLPLENPKERNKAIVAVNDLYVDFLEQFKSTQCRQLTRCDFSQQAEIERYVKEEVYKEKCFKYFDFVMDRFIELEKARMKS